jgi:outer membrane murein-binding lipoprotein Lpp
VSDATKDYPGVTATVVNGEIVLSGTIERSKWMKLNPTLQSLNPKRVKTDQLVIK